MKTSTKIYYAVLVIILLSSIITYLVVSSVGWSRIETKLRSEGTIKSTINEVQASGWDLRTISLIDTHGRYCTTLFTNEKGGFIDCDFKGN